MKWDNVGEQPCSMARFLSVLGDRWTLLILRNAFYGVRRFDDFQESLGVTRHVLSERLKRLVEHDILYKSPYVNRQERFEYRLTAKGKDIFPILVSMASWADKWMDEGQGKPIIYTHTDCGHLMEPVLVCSACKEPVTAHNIQAQQGPGFNYYQESALFETMKKRVAG